jgi:tetratricopeptide (TPR) repeat protein
MVATRWQTHFLSHGRCKKGGSQYALEWKGNWKETGAVMAGISVTRKSCLPITPVFLLSIFLLLSVSSAWAQTAASEIEPVQVALRNREYGQALELVRSALQRFPRNAELWAMQGAAYAGLGHTKEALAAFRNALTLAPDSVPALQGEAQIEFEAGSAAAIPVLKHLLRLHPGERTSHGMLAVLQYGQGNCTDAVVHFEKAAPLFDSQIDGLHAYAVCLVKLRQFDQAARVFQRSLALSPDDKRERRLLAAIQLMAHQSQSAIATLQPLLDADHADAATLELASAAYEDNHDTEKAVELLRQSILLEPENANLYLEFANLSSVHQSFQVGIDVVNDGLSQQPKAAPLYFARGVLYVELGKYEQAQADFEKAYELDPNQSLSIAAQGLAAVNANDLDRALKTIQTSLRQKPNDPILLYLEADVLTRKGGETDSPDFQLAMRSAKKAVSLRPTLGAARAVLAKLYLQAGQYREAVEQCRKAIEIDPKDQTSLYRLIQALRKTGNNSEIPGLLKRLALLREEAAKEEKEHYRYKVVEGEAQIAPPSQP